MTKDKALKLALEALEVATTPLAKDRQEVLRARAAIREALALSFRSTKCEETSHAQPEQEPVAWRYRSVSPFVGKDGTYKVSDGWTLIREPEKRDAHSAMCGMEAEPLYTTPQPQREWVGLTDEETDHLFNMYERSSFGLVRAVEAKLKEKNT